VAIPTETVYGLAANAYNAEAVDKIFEIKGRPADNPLIVHVSNLVMLKNVVASMPGPAAELAKRFWPGPLTMVMEKTEAIGDNVTCGMRTVAVRMPSQASAAGIIECAGLPLAAPSANLSGRPSPTTARHVYDDLKGRIPLIVDDGPCAVGVESTVISLSGEPPIILRPGIISLEEIRAVVPGAGLSGAAMARVDDGRLAESPGMKYKHYSPKANLTLVRGTLEQFVEYTKKYAAADTYAMCFDGEDGQIAIPSVTYGERDNPEMQARKLFSVLRALDQFGASSVFVRCPSREGASLAIYNRLIRAAGYREVEL
jgi:L-threonylcarbamoyladenylate synthase